MVHIPEKFHTSNAMMLKFSKHASLTRMNNISHINNQETVIKRFIDLMLKNHDAKGYGNP